MEYNRYSVVVNGYVYKSTRYNDLGSESQQWSSWTFGGEGIFHPTGTKVPVYYLAGAYLRMWRLHSYGSFTSTDKVNGTQSYLVNDQDSRNEPALSLGIGLAMTNHAAVETRMTFANYRKQAYNTVDIRLVLTL